MMVRGVKELNFRGPVDLVFNINALLYHISVNIVKVIFHLHESIAEPRRVKTSPPYVVKETGYGSFVLSIDVFFNTTEKKFRKVSCFLVYTFVLLAA